MVMMVVMMSKANTQCRNTKQLTWLAKSGGQRKEK